MKTIRIGDVVGEYEVIGTAGAGGMGTVYKIQHVITRRVEAMKLLPPGTAGDPEEVDRFEREIRLQARLHHPNLVTLYNAVRDGDSIALIMEFVEGESLQRRLEAGALPIWTAVKIAIEVLGGLAYAHKAGVVHRDVTPANIILTQDLEAKLTDFGLARNTAESGQINSDAPAGSPSYMSPEQIRGLKELDARTDIYAMGAVLHEMLTGRKLFEADGAFAILRAHVEAAPRLPSQINPKVPAALDRIVSTAVAKDPAMRFQSAAAFRQALQRFALDTRTPQRMVSPRKIEQTILPRLQLHFQEVRASRAMMVMALAPILLVGFYAVKLFPYAGRDRSIEISAMTAVTHSKIDPPVDPQPPAAAESAKADPPAIKKESPAKVAHPTESRWRSSQTEKPKALPPALVPTQQTARVLEPPKSDAQPGPSPVAPLPVPPPPDAPGQQLHDAEATNPQTGNRFLKALGKVNLLRWRKRDAAKSMRKPD